MSAAPAESGALETSKFLTPALAKEVKELAGTPVYVYDEKALITQATNALTFPNRYGLTVRYAMKASPNAAILQLFSKMGLHFDASSGFECTRAMLAGVPAANISLSTQEFPENFAELYEKGIEVNLCSVEQVRKFGQLFPGGKCGLRFNPGRGSGGTGKTNVGGPSSSFGIWHELKGDVKELVKQYELNVVRIHTHIGSGSDPKVWQDVTNDSINLVREFPGVTALNLGGGYKVGRMSHEKSTEMKVIGEPVRGLFEDFAKETGRELKLEIEPGTYLVANSGTLLSTVQDMTTTGSEGHTFLKLDSGMTEVLRPSLYGAEHPIVVMNDSDETAEYIVVGHCCESGDLFSCEPGEPETLDRKKMKKVELGDIVSLEGSGAYCAGMNTKNYNSFPEAPEVMLDQYGKLHVIRKRQELAQIIENEVPYETKC